MPRIVRSASGPKDREQSAPTAPVSTNSRAQAQPRFMPRSSVRYATPTSISETDDVRAEKRTVRKNRMAAMELSQGIVWPICEKMYGRVSNISPGPQPGSMPAANTAGMMAKPASIANNKSETAVPTPVTRRFSFLLTYEE